MIHKVLHKKQDTVLKKFLLSLMLQLLAREYASLTSALTSAAHPYKD